MNNKYTIINAIDINDDYSIIIIKKNKNNMKKCIDCPYCKWWGDMNSYFCNKHKGLVDKTDYCIEEGM